MNLRTSYRPYSIRRKGRFGLFFRRWEIVYNDDFVIYFCHSKELAETVCGAMNIAYNVGLADAFQKEK